jgi:opacity protein-like surface antigen
MKKRGLIVAFFILSLAVSAQFEQKASINFSIGTFKTSGDKTMDPVPKQMPWYKPGISGEAGVQFNISSKFSLLAEIGIMYSSKWYCVIDDYNWLMYEVWQDTVTMLSSGLNEMSLLNFSLSVKPKLYLIPQNKFRPFLYAGLSINYTKAPFKDHYWEDCIDFGLNDPGDDSPWPYLQKNFGFGINPGIGIEYSPNDKVAFWFASGFNIIFINENNFPYDSRENNVDGNLGAFHAEAGLRFSFLKSKDL